MEKTGKPKNPLRSGLFACWKKMEKIFFYKKNLTNFFLCDIIEGGLVRRPAGFFC